MSSLTAELTNSPQHLLLKLEKAQPFSFTTIFVDQSEDPVDLTDCELEFALSQPVHKGGGVIFSVLGSGPVGNEFVLGLSGAQLNLPVGSYPFAITLNTASMYTSVIAKGTVELVANGSGLSGVPAGITPDTLTFRILKSNTVAVTVNHMPVPNLSAVLTVLGSGKAPTVEISGVWPNQVLELGLPATGAVFSEDMATQAELNEVALELAGVEAVIDGKQDLSAKGAANGYAALDSGGKVPMAQLPGALMSYEGTYNPSTNTPNLVDGTASYDAGAMFRISASGTRNFGNGNITFASGDYVIYNGARWEKSDGTDDVSSVAGKTGAVTLVKGDVGLGNVDNTSDASKPISTAQAAVNSSLNTLIAAARGTRWDVAVAYVNGDVVQHAGQFYYCVGANTGKVPGMLSNGFWVNMSGRAHGALVEADPHFDEDNTLISAWETFWKTGTSVASRTTTAGEFETGVAGLKFVLSASSSQRLFPKDENYVRPGEVIQIQVRTKLSAAAAGVTVDGSTLQNDSVATPTPLAAGVVGASSLEGVQTIDTTWRTFTFTMTATTKPRMMANLVFATGANAANVLVDWIRVKRFDSLGDALKPAMVLQQNAAVSMATGTHTRMNSATTISSQGLMVNDAGAIKVPCDGWYEVFGQHVLNSSATATIQAATVDVSPDKDTTPAQSAPPNGLQNESPKTSTSAFVVSVGGPVWVPAGYYIRLWLYHNSATTPISNNHTSTQLRAVYKGV